MRFPSSDPRYALLRFGDGRPIKIDAHAADQLPDAVHEYDEVLFNLLRAAYENGDQEALSQLWGAAHIHRSTHIVPSEPNA